MHPTRCLEQTGRWGTCLSSLDSELRLNSEVPEIRRSADAKPSSLCALRAAGQIQAGGIGWITPSRPIVRPASLSAALAFASAVALAFSFSALIVAAAADHAARF